jgi:ABC-type polysaccharide/polyol phosphate transport system ATPase subunit
MSMSSIVLTNVTVTYPQTSRSKRSLRSELISYVAAVGGKLETSSDGIAVCALENVSLSIAPGERVGLIGPNGAGKTTLLRVVAGIFKPSAGSIVVTGRPHPIFSSDLGIAPSASGLDNIYLRGYALGLSYRDIEARIREIAEFSELGPYLEMPVEIYSPGMRARLAFSVTTSITPDILVLDEWLAAGDQHFAKKAEARMRQLIDISQILIFATHRLQLLRDVATRLILLDRGSIIADGSPEEVLELYNARFS